MRGSAVVDFALVVPLVLAVVLGLAQLVLTWHVRVLMTNAAQEGARAAAATGANLPAVKLVIDQLLADSLAQGLVSEVNVDYRHGGPIGLAEVNLQGRLPVLGLLGPNKLQVVGYSVLENW